jgi:hypothetical protein
VVGFGQRTAALLFPPEATDLLSSLPSAVEYPTLPEVTRRLRPRWPEVYVQTLAAKAGQEK